MKRQGQINNKNSQYASQGCQPLTLKPLTSSPIILILSWDGCNFYVYFIHKEIEIISNLHSWEVVKLEFGLPCTWIDIIGWLGGLQPGKSFQSQRKEGLVIAYGGWLAGPHWWKGKEKEIVASCSFINHNFPKCKACSFCTWYIADSSHLNHFSQLHCVCKIC